eukprot:UN01842
MIDFDRVRRFLPEFNIYNELNPLTAGEMTQKESGYIAEILHHASFDKSCNIVMDGTLQHGEWYTGVFENIKKTILIYEIIIT